MNTSPPNRRRPNAPDDAAERAARHLRICQELAHFEMALARAADERSQALARRRVPDHAGATAHLSPTWKTMRPSGIF